MALLWIDSFDHYVTADAGEKYQHALNQTISAGNGRRSTAGLRLSAGSGYVITPHLAPGTTTAIVGVAVSPGGLAATQRFFIIRDGATEQVTVGCDASGFITARRGSGTGTVLGTAVAGALSSGVYAYLEAKVTIHGSTGTVDVRVNGTSVLSLTGQNTANSGSAAWDNIELSHANGTTTWDDFYVLDSSGSSPTNDFLGDCRVDVRDPTAEGNSSSWTPLSGTDNALMVDDAAPDDDTTYVSTGTLNQVDTHVVEDAPVVGATIYGAQLCISVKKSDAGAGAIAPVVRHSGADTVGSSSYVGTAYGYVVTPYGVNPGTSAAWTESDFNAAEFGYKRTA